MGYNGRIYPTGKIVEYNLFCILLYTFCRQVTGLGDQQVVADHGTKGCASSFVKKIVAILSIR